MKGVSTVVATVLVLMITVALAASAYLWFTNIFSSVTTGAGQSVGQVGTQVGTSFSITSAAGTGTPTGETMASVYLLNTGTVDIPLTSVSVFINNLKTTHAPTTGTLVAGTSQTLTLTDEAGDDWSGSFCSRAVKVTVQGGVPQTGTISC